MPPEETASSETAEQWNGGGAPTERGTGTDKSLDNLNSGDQLKGYNVTSNSEDLGSVVTTTAEELYGVEGALINSLVWPQSWSRRS
jgi:hypothetical protein